MNKDYMKRDFIIKDLVVSIAGGGSGTTWMPGPDQDTPPSPISPVASVLVNIDLIEAVRATILDALKMEKDFESIGQAFVKDGAGGNPTIRNAIYEMGAAVVGSAIYAQMAGGKVGMPDPNCDGTSLETIPPTLTPVILTGREIHRVTELPRLREQLAEATEYMEKAAASQVPVGDDVQLVREKLEGALKTLR
jgi:hypothetical protein